MSDVLWNFYIEKSFKSNSCAGVVDLRTCSILEFILKSLAKSIEAFGCSLALTNF